MLTTALTNAAATLVDGVFMADMKAINLFSEDWCWASPSVTEVAGGGLVSGDEFVCVYGEDITYEFPFVPFSVTNPAGCSDAETHFLYWVEQDLTFDFTIVHLSVDPFSNILRLELGPGTIAILPEGFYTFTVHGTLPNRQDFTWPLSIRYTQCINEVLHPPVYVP